ncbi:unnamed protein product [Rotaria sp. Silwood2]|nr:unnamed protein product [Rotaria sp. Silwood2]
MTIYCNARAAEDFFRSEQKRSCVPFNGRCNVDSDCCGSDDPDSGHCLLCTGVLDYFFEKNYDEQEFNIRQMALA